MLNRQLSALDYAIIGVYFVVVLGIGAVATASVPTPAAAPEIASTSPSAGATARTAA